MKITVNKHNFIDAIEKRDRLSNFNNDYDLIENLFNFLDELDPNLELDIVAICCDYEAFSLEEYNSEFNTNYETIEEIINNDDSIAVHSIKNVFKGYY